MDCNPPGSSVHGIHQALLSMGFSRQEYWSGLLCPPPGPLNPGNKPGSPAMQTDSLPSEPPGKPFIQFISFAKHCCSLNFVKYFIVWSIFFKNCLSCLILIDALSSDCLQPTSYFVSYFGYYSDLPRGNNFLP